MKARRFLNGVHASRLGRALFLVAAFLLLATIVRPGPRRSPAGPAEAALTVIAVDLEEDRANQRRAGELLFLRGWALTSDEPRFGAISAMQIDNGRVIALSDAGNLLLFDLPRRPGSLPLQIRPLPYRPGTTKRNRDTESLWIDEDQVWIGFEAVNAIKRFRRTDWREESAASPAAM